MLKSSFLLIFIFTSFFAFGQRATSLKDIEPVGKFENTSVKQLYTDPYSTTYLIWIKKEVRSHVHQEHTEQLYVVSGKADLFMGGKQYEMKKGRMYFIPPNVIHGLIVTSKKPLKVVSMQSPEFDGSDRVIR
ncbi:MAG: mannose-6-phosphate isomerase-like protein (cupin superfamily) [Sphingobacteriales bacterium]|jgi:mannose-6-phosphate isomerase-like protein (cupin superfamily)